MIKNLKPRNKNSNFVFRFKMFRCLLLPAFPKRLLQFCCFNYREYVVKRSNQLTSGWLYTLHRLRFPTTNNKIHQFRIHNWCLYSDRSDILALKINKLINIPLIDSFSYFRPLSSLTDPLELALH